MALLVYITCADFAEARRIAETLLDERLIACANIVSAPVTSFYVWRGKREESSETLVLAKTMEDRFSELSRRVRELHSYEVPCVTAIPVAAGNPDYLAWVEENTRPLVRV